MTVTRHSLHVFVGGGGLPAGLTKAATSLSVVDGGKMIGAHSSHHVVETSSHRIILTKWPCTASAVSYINHTPAKIFYLWFLTYLVGKVSTVKYLF